LISEDEVSEAVSDYLRKRGFRVGWVKAGLPGFDIEAIHADGTHWLIESKGAANSKAAPAPDRRQYGNGQIFTLVGQAFLTAVSWLDREGCRGARIGIALPKTLWFDRHSAKIERVCRREGITIFRVDAMTKQVSETI
jgi:hypothetical protein